MAVHCETYVPRPTGLGTLARDDEGMKTEAAYSHMYNKVGTR